MSKELFYFREAVVLSQMPSFTRQEGEAGHGRAGQGREESGAPVITKGPSLVSLLQLWKTQRRVSRSNDTPRASSRPSPLLSAGPTDASGCLVKNLKCIQLSSRRA